MSFKQLWQEPKNRSKTYNILNNIFSAITHGIGFCLAVAGLVILIVKAAHTGSAVRVTAFTLYGSSLIILYLFSTLYHSLIFTRARRVFQISFFNFHFNYWNLYALYSCCNRRS